MLPSGCVLLSLAAVLSVLGWFSFHWGIGILWHIALENQALANAEQGWKINCAHLTDPKLIAKHCHEYSEVMDRSHYMYALREWSIENKFCGGGGCSVWTFAIVGAVVGAVAALVVLAWTIAVVERARRSPLISLYGSSAASTKREMEEIAQPAAQSQRRLPLMMQPYETSSDAWAYAPRVRLYEVPAPNALTNRRRNDGMPADGDMRVV